MSNNSILVLRCWKLMCEVIESSNTHTPCGYWKVVQNCYARVQDFFCFWAFLEQYNGHLNQHSFIDRFLPIGSHTYLAEMRMSTDSLYSFIHFMFLIAISAIWIVRKNVIIRIIRIVALIGTKGFPIYDCLQFNGITFCIIIVNTCIPILSNAGKIMMTTRLG